MITQEAGRVAHMVRKLVATFVASLMTALGMGTAADAADRPFRGGSFGELRDLKPIAGRVIACIPALPAFLAHQEKRLGRTLTEDEFDEFRDLAPAIEMDRADADKMLKGGPLPADLTFAAWQQMRAK